MDITPIDPYQSPDIVSVSDQLALALSELYWVYQQHQILEQDTDGQTIEIAIDDLEHGISKVKSRLSAVESQLEKF